MRERERVRETARVRDIQTVIPTDRNKELDGNTDKQN